MARLPPRDTDQQKPPRSKVREHVVLGPDDLVETRRRFERTTTQLERSFGPSCLLSLIIVFLVLVVVKRFMQVPWPLLLIIAAVVWYLVLLLLVRWRPDVVEEEE